MPHAHVTQTSRLAAPPAQVWARIVSVEGINAELMPIVRMTFPQHRARLDDSPPAAGVPMFRSTLLLFGVLPIDLHTCVALDLSPGEGFRERSHSLVHRAWAHARQLRTIPGGTELTDTVDYQCRLPGLAAVLRPIVNSVFAHRHRQLRRHFGEVPSPSG